MPTQNDLKRRVRERMTRTGESYTAARAHVVRTGDEQRDLAAIAGMSDVAVKAKTGRDWLAWVRVLDRAGAASKTHTEIAKWLRDEHEVAAWWAQTVTVSYERIRGLREKGQQRGGGYDVNKSKTVGVPIEQLYAAFGARGRRHWLAGVDLRIKTARPNKSLRIKWQGGTSVDVYFWDKSTSGKGPQSPTKHKSQVQLQHRGLPDKRAADRMRTFWTERFAELQRTLNDSAK